MADAGKLRSANETTKKKNVVSKLLGKPIRTQRNSHEVKGRDNLSFMPGIGADMESNDVPTCIASVGSNRRQDTGNSVAQLRNIKHNSCSAEDKKRAARSREIGCHANFSKIPEDGPYSGPGRPPVTGLRRNSDFIRGSPIVKCGSTTALETLAGGTSESPIYEELDLKSASSRDLNIDRERTYDPRDVRTSLVEPTFSKHGLSFSSRYLEHRGLYSRPSCGVRIAELRASRKQEGMRTSPSSVSSHSSSSPSHSLSEAGASDRCVLSRCDSQISRRSLSNSLDASIDRNHRSSLDLNVTYVEHFDETDPQVYNSSQYSRPASCCPLKPPPTSGDVNAAMSKDKQTRVSTFSASTQTTLTTTHRDIATAARLASSRQSPEVNRKETEARTATAAAPLPPPCSVAANKHLGRLQSEQRPTQGIACSSAVPENTHLKSFAQERLAGSSPRPFTVHRSYSESDGCSDYDVSLASSQNSTDTLTDSVHSYVVFADDTNANEDLTSSGTTDDNHSTATDSPIHRTVEKHSNTIDQMASGISRQAAQVKTPTRLLRSSPRSLEHLKQSRRSSEVANVDVNLERKCLTPSVSCPIQRPTNCRTIRKPSMLSNSTAKPVIQRTENFGQSVDSKIKSQSIRLSKSSSSNDLPTKSQQPQAPGSQANRPSAKVRNRSSDDTDARKTLTSRQKIPTASAARATTTAVHCRFDRSDSEPASVPGHSPDTLAPCQGLPPAKRDASIDSKVSAKEMRPFNGTERVYSSSSSSSEVRATRLARSFVSPPGCSQLHPMSAAGISCKMLKRPSNADLVSQHPLSPIAERSPHRRTFVTAEESSSALSISGCPSRAQDAPRVMPAKTTAMAPVFRNLSASQRATSLSKLTSEKSNPRVGRTASNANEIHDRELSRKFSEDNDSKLGEVSKSQANIYESTTVQMRSDGILQNSSSSCVALNACRGFQNRNTFQQRERAFTNDAGKASSAKQPLIRAAERNSEGESLTQQNSTIADSTKTEELQSPVRNKETKPDFANDSPKTTFNSKLKTPTEYNIRRRLEKSGDRKNSEERFRQRSTIETDNEKISTNETNAAQQTPGATSVFKQLQMRHVKPYSCASNKSYSITDKFTTARINSEREKSRAKAVDSKTYQGEDKADQFIPLLQGDLRQDHTSKQQEFREETYGESLADFHDQSKSSLGNQTLVSADDSSHAQSHRDRNDNSNTSSSRSESNSSDVSEYIAVDSRLLNSSEGLEIQSALPKTMADQNLQETDSLAGNSNSHIKIERSEVQSPNAEQSASNQLSESLSSNDLVTADFQRNEALAMCRDIIEQSVERILREACHEDTCRDDALLLSGDEIISETGFRDSSIAVELSNCTEVDVKVPIGREERTSRAGHWRSLRSGQSVQDHGSQTTLSDIGCQANEAILIKPSNRNSLVLVEPETPLLGDFDKFVVTYESNNIIVFERAASVVKGVKQKGGNLEMTKARIITDLPAPFTSREIASKLAEELDCSKSADVKTLTSPKWEPGNIPLSESGYDSWKSQSSKSSTRILKLSETEIYTIPNLGSKFAKSSEDGDQYLNSRYLLLKDDDANKSPLDFSHGNFIDDENEVIGNLSCYPTAVRTNNDDYEISMERFSSRIPNVDGKRNTTDARTPHDDGLANGVQITAAGNIFFGEFSPSMLSFPSSCSSPATIDGATLTRTTSDERLEMKEKSVGDISPRLLLSPDDDRYGCGESLDLPDVSFGSWGEITSNSAAYNSKDYHNQIYKLDFGTGDSGELTNDQEEADFCTKRTPLPLASWLSGVNYSGAAKPNSCGNFEDTRLISLKYPDNSKPESLQQHKRASCEFNDSRCNQVARVHSNTFPLTIKKTYADVFSTKEATNFAETCQIFSRLNKLKQKTEKDTFYENMCDALLENMEPDLSDSDTTPSPTSPEFEKSAEHPGVRSSAGKISETNISSDKTECDFNRSKLDFKSTIDGSRPPFSKFPEETPSSDNITGKLNRNRRISDNSPAKQLIDLGQHQEQAQVTTEENVQTSRAVTNETTADLQRNTGIVSVSTGKEPFSVSHYCIDEQKLRLEGVDSSKIADSRVEVVANVLNVSRANESLDLSYKDPDDSSLRPYSKPALVKQEAMNRLDSSPVTPALPVSANEDARPSSSSILSRYFPSLMLRKSSKDRHGCRSQEVGTKTEKSLSLDRSMNPGLRNSASICHDRKFRNSNVEEQRSVKEVIKQFEDQTFAALESSAGDRTKPNETSSQSQDQKGKKTKLIRKPKS